MEIKKIAVIGAGTMGTGIAQVAAASGFDVVLNDVDDAMLQRSLKIMDKSLERMREIAQREVPVREKIYAAIDLHTEVYGADPVRMALIAYNQKSLNPEHWDELREKQKEYSAILRGFLTQMRDAGETADLNPTLCTFALFGMIQSAYLWFDPQGEVKPDELREMFARIFTAGVLTKEDDNRQTDNRRLTG